MTVQELRVMLDYYNPVDEILIDGADKEGKQIWLKPILVRATDSKINIVANEVESP